VLSKTVVIVNELGLHARCAARIAEIAAQAKSKVWLIRDGEQADAASILDMLMLFCPKDSQIAVRVDDPRDVHVMDAIVKLIEQGFGE